MSVYSWSTTAGSNASSDASINWQEGQQPSTINDSARAMMAAIAAWIQDQGAYATTGGSSNAYTLALSQTMAAKVPSLISFVADRNNTGAATLNVDSTGAYPLRAATGAALAANDIVAGNVYQVTWVSGSSEWLLVGAAPFLKKTGGTMTGAITLPGDPTDNLHATTKQYTDALGASAIVTATPPGAVMPFAMNTAPSGWLAADGAAISRATYAPLFAAIGTTHGAGNGVTTFNVPDLRGYFVRGSGTNSDGTAAGTFGAKQGDAYKNHSHPITDKAHSHTLDVYNTGQGTSGGGGTVYFGGSRSTSLVFTGITSTDASTTGDTETRPKNIALLYCIKT